MNRGRWIPWAFVAGFGVVIAVNGVMVWQAISTFGGISVTDAYGRGLAYNRVIEAVEADEAAGLALHARFASGGIELTLPAETSLISARLVRPVGQRIALDLDFRALGTGRHRAEIVPPLPGQWELQVRARHDGRVVRLAERVMAP
ncbi:MAG: FixH family protein [Alphaproteobacteria bacterium]|nr:FixH family protein [Alphaproteobacteria bacterium]